MTVANHCFYRHIASYRASLRSIFEPRLGALLNSQYLQLLHGWLQSPPVYIVLNCSSSLSLSMKNTMRMNILAMMTQLPHKDRLRAVLICFLDSRGASGNFR